MTRSRIDRMHFGLLQYLHLHHVSSTLACRPRINLPVEGPALMMLKYHGPRNRYCFLPCCVPESLEQAVHHSEPQVPYQSLG